MDRVMEMEKDENWILRQERHTSVAVKYAKNPKLDVQTNSLTERFRNITKKLG